MVRWIALLGLVRVHVDIGFGNVDAERWPLVAFVKVEVCPANDSNDDDHVPGGNFGELAGSRGPKVCPSPESDRISVVLDFTVWELDAETALGRLEQFHLTAKNDLLSLDIALDEGTRLRDERYAPIVLCLRALVAGKTSITEFALQKIRGCGEGAAASIAGRTVPGCMSIAATMMVMYVFIGGSTYWRDSREMPNDPKLTDTRRWRDCCAAGRASEARRSAAASVTPARVRCSARLGVVGLHGQWSMLELRRMRNTNRYSVGNLYDCAVLIG